MILQMIGDWYTTLSEIITSYVIFNNTYVKACYES